MSIVEIERADLLNRHEKGIRYFLYTIVTCTVFVNFLQVQGGGDIWKVGDWLINYQAGFVRRGLIGEVLYIISPEGWLLFSVVLLQSLLYIVICHFVLEEFFLKERGAVDGLIIFSPAFIFFFPFYHINGGMRKELIAFFAFVLLLQATRQDKRDGLLLLSIAVYALGVFSHAMIALFVVFYIYAFLKRSAHSFRQKVLYVSLLIAIALSGVYLSSVFHGDHSTADSICSSLVLKGVDCDVCEGAISALSGTMLSEMLDVSSRLPSQFLYIILFVLSFVPFAFVDLRRYMPLLILGFLSILPLFIVATDWGRWIHIYMTFLFLFYIYDNPVKIKLDATKPLVAFFVVYLFSWRLPAYDPDLMNILGAFTIPCKVWNVFYEIVSSF